MSNENLPALNMDSLVPEGFDDGAGMSQGGSPDLKINHDTGEWESNGVKFGTVMLSIWAQHYFRVCHNASYESKDKRVACNSWDGVNAFGHGGKVPRGEAPDFQQRKCAERTESGLKIVCPSAHGDPWDCRPSIRVFGMFGNEDGGNWLPYFWRVNGKSVRLVDRLISSFRTAAAAKSVQQTQLYVVASLRKEREGDKFYVPHFSSPQVLDLDDPGVKGVLDFASEAPAYFKSEWAKEKDFCLTIEKRWNEA